MIQVKRCVCIGILVLLCSSFSLASRILLDHNPDDQKQKDTHNHRTDAGSAISEQVASSGIGIGYGIGGGGGGGAGSNHGYGQGVGVGSGGYGYGSGSGVGTGNGGGSGTGIGVGHGIGEGEGIGIGQGSGGGGYMPGGGTGIGGGGGGMVIPGIGVVPGTGGMGAGIGIGAGTGTVIPVEGCIPGAVNCPNVPACGQPGYPCGQPISGCPNCRPQNGWKPESKGETQQVSPQDVHTKMAKEPAEPTPPNAKETSINHIPPHVTMSDESAVNGSND